ncbi:MAG: hypothetical protein IJC02_14380 [Lachnospiraceae bacterium]|nr:hypothetical protein [Lachnospiraceae bacterium]
MSGWDLQFGNIKEYDVTEDRIWSLFNFEFNDFKGKRNTYKYGLIKSLLDNIFNGYLNERGVISAQCCSPGLFWNFSLLVSISDFLE